MSLGCWIGDESLTECGEQGRMVWGVQVRTGEKYILVGVLVTYLEIHLLLSDPRGDALEGLRVRHQWMELHKRASR